MAEQPCLPHVQACAMRLAKLDQSGVPLPGADNLYVTDALSSLQFTAVYTDADEIEEKGACGTVVINYKGDDSFKRGDVQVNLWTPDPYIQEFLSDGGAVITDGDRIGFAAPPLGTSTGNGVSIELWAKRIDNGDLDADSPYAWWVYPKVRSLRLGSHTHENGPLLPSFTGQAVENPNWFDGPLNDWPAASDRVFQWLPTDTIPTVACGPSALAAS